MENNLRVAHVGDNEKTDYVTHYLAGSAGAWRETTRALLPQNEVVAWDAFKCKFPKRYVGWIDQYDAREVLAAKAREYVGERVP